MFNHSGKKQTASAIALPFFKTFRFVELPSLTKETSKTKEYDFFKSAGLWKDREISQEILRAKAWKKI